MGFFEYCRENEITENSQTTKLVYAKLLFCEAFVCAWLTKKMTRVEGLERQLLGGREGGGKKKSKTAARAKERERRFSIKYLRWRGGAEPHSLPCSVRGWVGGSAVPPPAGVFVATFYPR